MTGYNLSCHKIVQHDLNFREFFFYLTVVKLADQSPDGKRLPPPRNIRGITSACRLLVDGKGRVIGGHEAKHMLVCRLLHKNVEHSLLPYHPFIHSNLRNSEHKPSRAVQFQTRRNLNYGD